MSPSSRIPDHCRAYALSYQADLDYVSSCDHEHDLACDRCEVFPNVVHEIESALENAEISSDEKDEMKYVVSLAKKRIEAWKAHLLRSINQDEARLDVLRNLDAYSVLLVLDWAMKYLPRKYHESQTDWFGKRGISWHITTATRIVEGQPQMLSFVHVFQSCNQDSVTVLAIVDDVLKQLKSTMPNVYSVHFRQDNAGCYHSASTLVEIQQVAKKYDISVGLDFSDPQGGKGSCDRKAAAVKNHIRIYLNSGQDVETPEQMKNAVESSGGMPGVRVMLCDTQNIPKSVPVKWEGVSFIHNIKYGNEGMRVWRSYAVGPGKFLPWSQFDFPDTCSVPMLTILKEARDPKATFTAITARRKSPQTQQGEEQLASGVGEASDEQSEDDMECHCKLFACPEEGCVKSFQRFSSLEHHLDVGRHKYVLESLMLLDKAMMSYASKLEQGVATVDNPVEDTGTAKAPDSRSSLSMGWVLKSSGTQRTRLTENQKQYLTEVFKIGEQTGKKADASNVSKSMRKVRNADGSSRFDASSYLTSQQVASFFSRLASKKVVQADESEDEEDEHAEELNKIHEQNIQDLSNEVMAQISLQHPIMYDTHNICEIAACSKLAKFSVQMLQDICNFYQLDISTISVKRKKPYIDLLTKLVDSCRCNASL